MNNGTNSSTLAYDEIGLQSKLVDFRELARNSKSLSGRAVILHEHMSNQPLKGELLSVVTTDSSVTIRLTNLMREINTGTWVPVRYPTMSFDGEVRQSKMKHPNGHNGQIVIKVEGGWSATILPASTPALVED